jgi:hypothetical protein
MVIGYDKVDVNHQQLMALPFEEACGLSSFDRARANRELKLNGPPTWTSILTGCGVISFNSATASEYLDCSAVNTVDLNFTSEDYTLVGWIYPCHTATSQMIMGRYAVDVDGWELYLYETPPNYYLQLRHHHASLFPLPARTGAYSNGWANDIWQLFGVTRRGGTSLHYRNGLSIEVTSSAGGLNNPDTCNRDLVIGTRHTKNADWFNGMMWNLRIWPWVLSPADMRFIFETERQRFGV